MKPQRSVRGVLRTTPRLAETVRLLGRHGFAGILRGTEHWPTPQNVRAAFEQLGIVFLKLGQVLSTRRDLLPPEYIAELERLQDRLPSEPFDAIARIVEEELGGPPQTLFSEFAKEPLAAATIAQVHAARLRDGRDVVVKVQRPGLQERILEDLAVLAYLAAVLDVVSPSLRPFDPPAMVREFHTSLMRELDFHREAGNVRRFRAALADAPGLWIPDVIPELSTRRIVTFEHSTGLRISTYLTRHPEQGSELARRLASLFLRQVFEEGLFHADPHPGNFFVLEDGTLCLHDFGMIGELEPRMRDALADLLAGFVRGDVHSVAESYQELGLVGEDVDRRVLEGEVADLVREIRDRPLEQVSVGSALESLLRLGGCHRVSNPGVLLLLSRAFVTLEAVMRSLDPELSVIDAFREAMPRITLRRFTPERLARDAAAVAGNLDRLLREAPGEIRRAVRRLGEGELGDVRVREHPAVQAERERAVGLLIRTVGAGFLTLAGAVLLSTTGWRLAVAVGLLVLGLGGLGATAIRAALGKR